MESFMALSGDKNIHHNVLADQVQDIKIPDIILNTINAI